MAKLVDHYLVLGLPTGEEGIRLTERQITKAFKAKALRVHPDKRPPHHAAAAHSDFQNLMESYQILMDAKKRQEFDALLLAHLRSQKQQQQQQQKQKKRPNWTPNYGEEERKKRQKVQAQEIKKAISEFMTEIDEIRGEMEDMQFKDLEEKISKFIAELEKMNFQEIKKEFPKFVAEIQKKLEEVAESISRNTAGTKPAAETNRPPQPFSFCFLSCRNSSSGKKKAFCQF